MRCEQCGRDMKNAELWQLATDPKAPTSWSMKQLCWDCRQHPEKSSERAASQMEAGHDKDILPVSLERELGGYDDSPV